MSRLVWLCALVPFVGFGCQSNDPVSDGDGLARAEVALNEVPGGVKCIVVDVAAGGDTVEKTFAASAGTHASLSFGKLPLGPASFSGTAFNKPCPGDGSAPSGAPSWPSTVATTSAAS